MEISKEEVEKVNKYITESTSNYYKENFKGKDFEKALLKTCRKEIARLDKTYLNFALLRNVLLIIKKEQKLSEEQMETLNDVINITVVVSNRLYEIFKLLLKELDV